MKATRIWFLSGLIVVFALAGCMRKGELNDSADFGGGEARRLGSLTVSMAFPNSFAAVALGTYADIDTVVVDIFDDADVPLVLGEVDWDTLDDGDRIVADAEAYPAQPGQWLITITNLPITDVRVIAYGLDSGSQKIFRGASDPVTIILNTDVTADVVMSSIDDGTGIIVPQLNDVQFDIQPKVGVTSEYTFSVTGEVGGTLDWLITSPGGGGAFTPTSDTGVALDGGDGTADFLADYDPATDGYFIHTIRLTDPGSGNYSEAGFSILVVPLDTGDVSPTISVSPVITGLRVVRLGPTTLEWTVSVDPFFTSGGRSVKYAWSYTDTSGGGTIPTVADVDSPQAIMLGYDSTAAGDLTVTVTDTTGGDPGPLGSSSTTFAMPANQFP